MLAGRDSDIEQFRTLIARLSDGNDERSQIFYGLRGVGKTVLLAEFDIIATDAGWATSDVQEVGSQPDFRVTFARMAIRILREISRKHDLKARVDKALSIVKAFSIKAPAGLGVQLDIEAAKGVADSGDPEEDLRELLLEIGKVAKEAKSGAVFLIDEMQNLDSASLAAICIAFQAVSRASLPIALAGAGLPDLQVSLLAAKPYADRLFSYHELGRLAAPAARTALVSPAATQGLEFEDDAALLVVEESAGYPYFIQEYGRELWNLVESSPVKEADVAEVRAIVKVSLATSFYGPRLQMASDSERRYLAAMASLDDRPYRSAAVAKAYGADDQRAVSTLRDGLIKSGLIWSPRHGELDFAVPLFAEYLREVAPLSGFDG